jgi:hypothetical protein
MQLDRLAFPVLLPIGSYLGIPQVSKILIPPPRDYASTALK